MRLPVLESIISGECYEDVSFECHPNFNYYLKDINCTDFDSDNPFGFGCEFNDLCSRDANFSAKNRMSGYDSISVPDDIKLRRDERIEIEGINLELNLLCQQLYRFENDYDNEAELKIMVIETFEALCGYRRKFSNVNIKNAFGIFVFRFYFQYRDYFKEWESETARNHRLVKEIIEDRYINRRICNIQQDIDSMNGMMQNRIFSPHLVKALDDFIKQADTYLRDSPEHDSMFIRIKCEYTDTVIEFSNYVICLVFLGSNIVNEIMIKLKKEGFYPSYIEWANEVEYELLEKLATYAARNGGMSAIRRLQYEWKQRNCVCNNYEEVPFELPSLYKRIIKYLDECIINEEIDHRPIFEDTDCLDEKSPTFEDIVNMRIIDNRELNVEWVGDGLIKKPRLKLEGESEVAVDDVDRKIAVAKQKLVFLNNQNFLNDGYYELLIGWIEELIREGKCPTNVSKIQKPKSVAVEWITYTISLIYDELFENTTEIDSQWIEFVKKLKCINVKDETQTEEKRWIDAQNKFRQRPLIPKKCRKNIDKEERDRWFYDDVVLGKRMLNGK